MALPAATPESLDRRRGAAGAAYAWLREALLAGRLLPGQTLSENEIARELGVSRTPVREAIIRLENEGFLTVRPQVGTVVAPIDLDAVADGQFMREAVEGRAVALAAARCTADDARALKAQLREQARAAARNDHAAFLVLDDRMHQRLVAMSGRPNVWHAVEDVKAQLDRVRFISLEDPAWLATICAQHEAIVQHVVDRDARRAVAAMTRHLRTVFASMERIARRSPEYFRNATVPPVAGVARPRG